MRLLFDFVHRDFCLISNYVFVNFSLHHAEISETYWNVCQSSNPFERESEILDAIENIKDTVVTIDDKLRSATDDSDAKIEDQVSKLKCLISYFRFKRECSIFRIKLTKLI